VSDQAAFCQQSFTARLQAADDLQQLLTSAAGHGRLPRYDVIDDIRACLVEACGGCPGSGQHSSFEGRKEEEEEEEEEERNA
jgi:hypothetical protein